MPGRVVVQWDKEDCADMGIIKVDLLGLGMMAALQDAIRLVNSRESGVGKRESEEHVLTGGSVKNRERRREHGGPCSQRQSPNPTRRSREVFALPASVRPPISVLPTPDCRLPTPDKSSISRTSLPTTPPSTRCSRRPTPSACSRSSRGRRWRRCRGSTRLLLRSRRRSRPHPSRPDRRADGASVSEPARGAGAGQFRSPAARAHPQAHARRAAVSGAAAAHGDGGRGVHRRAGRGPAPGDGLQAIREAHEAARGAAARGDGEARHHRRDRRSHRALHHVVRALRLPRVACRQLRA